MILILTFHQMHEVLIDSDTFPVQGHLHLAFAHKEQFTSLASQEVQGPASTRH